eukprot:CAMPEP_0194108558 /NCGR_PEP_ID=MMETSP0150-20130528/8231_1 /TAXON_ID=122233 /ORGANISM="Chaetoceros debilis, Strain MM31A-1" /LENGTH=630 /DNA_ID=CAMNT_0038797285 /DNA_START=158 /DNA_END=2047 /DNA_ORIENTATION=+
MSSKIDACGSMKRSFSEMEKNEIADSVNCDVPKAFRVGYFIAIRRKRASAASQGKDANKSEAHQSCCVFGCWNDAQIYLKRMKMVGTNVEYDAFERLDDATQFAFEKIDAGQQASDLHTKGDIFKELDAISSISPFIGAYRKRKLEGQGPPFSDALLSGLEQLPQDALTNIYRYICPGSCRLAFINLTISVIGMVSKQMFQSCVRYVQQEPVILFADDLDTDSMKKLAFSLGNAAKVKEIHLGHPMSACITSLVLKFCDLSTLESLDLNSTSFQPESKWDVVKDGLVSIPFVNEHGKMSENEIFRKYSQYITESAGRSLKRIEMNLSLNWFELYAYLFQNFIGRLEELEFNFEGDSVPGDYFLDEKKAALKRMKELVHVAPRLKVLTLGSSWDRTIIDLKLQSKSLECLYLVGSDQEGPVIRNLDINCPALTTLKMRIVLEAFDVNRFIRSKHCGNIKVLHLYIDRMHGNHRRKGASITGNQVFGMIGKMSSLQELSFYDKSDLFFADVYLPPIERLAIYSPRLENIIHRSTSLKTMGLEMDELLNFKKLQFNLENVERLVITVQGEEKADEEDMRLAALSQTIKQRMPKLEFFELYFCFSPDDWDELAFVLKSKSLKKAYMPEELLANL